MPNHNTSILIPNSLLTVSNGSVEEYIRYVNSIPLLTHEQELILAHKWFDEQDIEAARYLVLSHLRLVVSIARTYNGYGLPLADIIQEGTMGLMKAVKRFDPTRGIKLVTFAVYWIRADINEYVVKNWRIVRTVTTKNQRKLFFNLRSNRKDIGNLSEAEAKRIAHDLNVSRDEIVDMNMRLTSSDVPMLNEHINDFAPESWLQDESSHPDSILEQKFLFRLQTDGIANALLQLDDRSQDIIKSRWLVDDDDKQTLTVLGLKYDLSAEGIRQLEVKALQKMKQFLQHYI